MIDENKIEQMIAALDISREEAIQLIKDDAEVDRMTSAKQIDSDLTEEQKKTIKKTKQGDRKPTTYKFESKRQKVENVDKKLLIAVMANALKGLDIESEIINAEREFKFKYNDVIYKITMSVPRK